MVYIMEPDLCSRAQVRFLVDRRCADGVKSVEMQTIALME